MNQIKGIIFDYGQTIHNSNEGGFVPNLEKMLEYLGLKYKLALVSITVSETPQERRKKLDKQNVSKYFEQILLVRHEDKSFALQEVIDKWHLLPQQVAVVGDEVSKEIAWGNKNGCLTVWLQHGKFANILPNDETGQPAYTICDLKELLDIF